MATNRLLLWRIVGQDCGKTASNCLRRILMMMMMIVMVMEYGVSKLWVAIKFCLV